jgi:hypothetical protein
MTSYTTGRTEATVPGEDTKSANVAIRTRARLAG